MAGFTLKKTAIYHSVSIFFKLIYGLVVNKVIAVYLGPGGLAAWGQIQNFVSLATSFATGFSTEAIVKFTSEYSKNKSVQKEYLSNVFKWVLCWTFGTSALMLVFSKQLSDYLIDGVVSVASIQAIAIFLFLWSGNHFLTSILNGQMKLRSLTLVHIWTSVTGLLLVPVLIYYNGIYYGVMGLVAQQVFILVLQSFLYVRYSDATRSFLLHLTSPIQKKLFRKHISFALASTFPSACFFVVLIIVRQLLSSYATLEVAGIWEALKRLSDYHVLWMTSILSVYFLPKITSIAEKKLWTLEVNKVIRFVLVGMIASSVVLYWMREWVVEVMFQKQFQPMVQYIPYYIFGDICRVLAWVFSYTLLAKNKTKSFLISEVSAQFLFLTIAFLSIPKYGLFGGVLAYAIESFVHLILVFWFVRKI